MAGTPRLSWSAGLRYKVKSLLLAMQMLLLRWTPTEGAKFDLDLPNFFVDDPNILILKTHSASILEELPLNVKAKLYNTNTVVSDAAQLIVTEPVCYYEIISDSIIHVPSSLVLRSKAFSKFTIGLDDINALHSSELTDYTAEKPLTIKPVFESDAFILETALLEASWNYNINFNANAFTLIDTSILTKSASKNYFKLNDTMMHTWRTKKVSEYENTTINDLTTLSVFDFCYEVL